MDSNETVDDFDSAFDEFSEKQEDGLIVNLEEDTEIVEETAEVPTEEVPVEDIWAGADDSLKSEYDKLRDNNDKLSHQAKSNAGRIGALQRKLNCRWCYTIRKRSG